MGVKGVNEPLPEDDYVYKMNVYMIKMYKKSFFVCLDVYFMRFVLFLSDFYCIYCVCYK